MDEWVSIMGSICKTNFLKSISVSLSFFVSEEEFYNL